MNRPTPTYLDRERTVPEALRWAKEQADPRRAALDWFVESLSQAHNLSGESPLKFRSFYAYLFSRAFDLTEEEARWECDRELGIQAKGASPYSDAAAVIELARRYGWSRDRLLLEVDLLVHPRKGLNAAALHELVDLCLTKDGDLAPYGQVHPLLPEFYRETVQGRSGNVVYTTGKTITCLMKLLYGVDYRLPSPIRELHTTSTASTRENDTYEVDRYFRHLKWRGRLSVTAFAKVRQPDDNPPSWTSQLKKGLMREALDRLLSELSPCERVDYLMSLRPNSTKEPVLSSLVNGFLADLVGLKNSTQVRVFKKLYVDLLCEGFEGEEIQSRAFNLLERAYRETDAYFYNTAKLIHFADSAGSVEDFRAAASAFVDGLPNGEARRVVGKVANRLSVKTFGVSGVFNEGYGQKSKKIVVGPTSARRVSAVSDCDGRLLLADRISQAVGLMEAAERAALKAASDANGIIHCHYCDAELSLRPDGVRVDLFDHVIALRDGGLTIPGNVYVVCQRCRSLKGTDTHGGHIVKRWTVGRRLRRAIGDYRRFEEEAKNAHEAILPGWLKAYGDDAEMDRVLADGYCKAVNGYWS